MRDNEDVRTTGPIPRRIVAPGTVTLEDGKSPAFQCVVILMGPSTDFCAL